MNPKAKVMLDALSEVPNPKVIVEIGCIRNETELASEGWSTVYLAEWVKNHENTLLAVVDRDSKHLNLARRILMERGADLWHIIFFDDDGENILTSCPFKIDFLYLDGGNPDDTFAQFQAAIPKLSQNAIVCIDDCHNYNNWEYGKGTEVIKWILRNDTPFNFEITPTALEYKTAVIRRV